MEKLNIVGKRSGKGFVAHKAGLVSALSKAVSAIVSVCGVQVGRKGFLAYLRALGGNMVKVAPNGEGLKVLCGSNTALLPARLWQTEGMAQEDSCELIVAPYASVNPNLGAMELAEALSRVIPFVERGKEARPMLKCVRFATSKGKKGYLSLTASDGFTLAECQMPFDGVAEQEVAIPAEELKGLASALKKAHRVAVSIEGDNLIVETEAIRYCWRTEIGKYPDVANYLSAFGNACKATATVDAREFAKAVASFIRLLPKENEAIILNIGGGSVNLSIREYEATSNLDAESEGEAVIAVKASYLISSMRAFGEMVELRVNEPSEPILLTQNGFRMVLMPLFVGLEGKAVEEAEKVASEAEVKGKGEAEQKPAELVESKVTGKAKSPSA